MKFKLYHFRLIIWLGLASVVGWLFFLKIVPGGKITYVQNFRGENYFIGKLSPGDRVRPIGEGSPSGDAMEIIGNPVYFSLKPSRRFDTAKVTIKYRVKDEGPETPIIEAGILTDQFWHYNLAPLQNSIVTELSKTWHAIKDEDIMLLQRQKKFDSFADFLANQPSMSQVATYNYNFGYRYNIPGYAPKNTSFKLPASVRGPFELYAYIKEENLNLNFSFLDLNNSRGSDPVKVRVVYEGQAIFEKELVDDGNREDNMVAGKPGGIKINIPGLPEGVYKIQVLVNGDIVTESLETSQSKLVFINKVWVYQFSGPELSLVTDSYDLSAQTNNPASRQKIKAGGKTLNLNDTYKQIDISLEAGSSPIILEKGDALLSGNGMFSFSNGQLFNPEIRKITAGFNPDRYGINYIIASYNEPASDGDWKVGSAEFDLTGAYEEKGKYNFILSIPGLKAEDEIKDSLEIKEIKVELEGKSLKQKLIEIF